ncbi:MULTISPECIES: hydroxymethylglutaryl-CoA synthase [Enterococcus]|uniref:hydroxymethylglutaryl-CoA synthase n=1 Tax=Enterococcus TaxID=1350 RepID=UPI0010F71062|nr:MULTISPECIES: hydroxymethylglutaryl-CoA synthase [Enterococcus]KAF1304205.1 hydroxymethylglutaryl-CoA synthase [Enterococcus sp. JM9B]
MTVGIDKISFFVPPYYIDMTDLANARNVDPNKFHIGIGQDQMAINPISQDIVTFAANAAAAILTEEDKQDIDMVVVGTESSIDESKASAVVLHRLMGIQPFARSFEIKEACYGATAGLQLAKNHVLLHPDKKVLVVAADIAKYGLASGGEPTQGAGAVAMLVTSDPNILILKDDSVSLTQDIYDFWRPTGYEYPIVDGPLSNETYINAFGTVWQEHKKRTNLDFTDYAALTFHIPYTKMGKKALLAQITDLKEEEQARLLSRYEESIQYSRRIGNLYTGSLYLGLISLLENSSALQSGDQIGLFSYGSGAVAEFFTGELAANFKKPLLTKKHQQLLNNRKQLSIKEYEILFSEKINLDTLSDYNDPTPYSIVRIKDNIRTYLD